MLIAQGDHMELYNKLKEMKIVLVDDDELIRDSLGLFLESEGCQLQAFATAEEGVGALAKQPYDIIIADYKLPGMDGLEFFKKIQGFSSPALKILITAYGSEEIFFEAKKAGVLAIIEKPFTSKMLEDSLATLLEKYDNRGRNDCAENVHSVFHKNISNSSGFA